MAKTAFQGAPVSLAGEFIKVGAQAPEFSLVKGDLSSFTQKDGQSFLYFSDNSNSFSICGDSLTKKEIISLAESLEPII